VDVEIEYAGGDIAALVGRLRTLIPGGASVAEAVAEIIADVGARGDQAVLEYTQRFDTGGMWALPLEVPASALQAGVEQLAPELRDAIALASANVGEVAVAAVNPDRTVELAGGSVTVREAPVQRAAVYVPGGRAPYPSTVVMGVVTARAAGVAEVAVCSPPGRAGEIDEVVLAACALTGADRVYRMGGAQAVAALALGTESVTSVDVIVGPGNLYVQEAKRQLSGHVGIDSFAGPSDLLVIADPGAAAAPIGLDLLAQAEHGPGTLVVAASTDEALLETLRAGVELQTDTGARLALVLLDNSEQALELAQAFAPEHLQLIGPQAEALAPSVSHAGCVFVGAAAGTAFGDYIVGSNHILPTAGAARFASSLSPRSFRRTFTEVRVTDPDTLARAAAPLARAEGFEFHARSMEARIRENQG
jgi:histidinol dehydrogenase